MAIITVVGNVNIETTVKIDRFPLDYRPTTFSTFGITSNVSAVGYNIAKALSVLGNTVKLASIVGNDINGQIVKDHLQHHHIDTSYVMNIAQATAQSTVLYDNTGKRMAMSDLKNITECAYPPDLFQQAIEDSDLVVLTNITYSKALLPIAQNSQKIIATDLHTMTDPSDSYNLPFLQYANILFMSGELLETPLNEWAATLFQQYPANIIVIGLGSRGAYLAIREPSIRLHIPAVVTRPIVQTGGAGDALFAAFLHGYLHTKDPTRSLQAATLFASYKIGATGSGDGFLTHHQLEELVRTHYGEI